MLELVVLEVVSMGPISDDATNNDDIDEESMGAVVVCSKLKLGFGSIFFLGGEGLFLFLQD